MWYYYYGNFFIIDSLVTNKGEKMTELKVLKVGIDSSLPRFFLEKKIEEHRKNGWKTFGKVTIEFDEENKRYAYTQALIRES